MSSDKIDINIDLTELLSGDDVPKEESAEKPKQQRARCHTERGQKMFEKRRFFSEKTMLDVAEWHYKQGDFYCFISGGDIDSLTFLKHVLRQQRLNYCLISTWCFGVEDAREIGTWIDKKLIDRIDFYVGEIAKASYAECTRDLTEISQKTGGRCGVFRNHSKVMLCYGERFDCAILSSANVNTNPRTENTVIICNTSVADFYKSYFDDIKPFNGSPENWKPYQKENQNANRESQDLGAEPGGI